MTQTWNMKDSRNVLSKGPVPDSNTLNLAHIQVWTRSSPPEQNELWPRFFRSISGSFGVCWLISGHGMDGLVVAWIWQMGADCPSAQVYVDRMKVYGTQITILPSKVLHFPALVRVI